MGGEFKWRHYAGEIILWAVRWYCRYGISYRELEEMMGERGVTVDHVTLYRWIQRYAPELEKRVRWYQGYRSSSWRVDETYVRVGGKWKYLFRAVDKQGRLIRAGAGGGYQSVWIDRRGGNGKPKPSWR